MYSSLLRYSFGLVSFFLLLVLVGCGSSRQSTGDSYPLSKLSEAPAYFGRVTQGHLEFYDFGKGSPIVLIPGYGTDVSSWDKHFLANLAGQHRLIVLNNRNVSRSEVHSDRYLSRDLANDTYQLMRDLQLKKPAVLGISMGGMIAQQLAVLHPENIGQLILINTAIAGKAAIHPSAEVEEQLMNMPADKLGRYEIAVKYFFPESWRTRMAVDVAVDRFQPENYQEIDPVSIMPLQRQLVRNWIHDESAALKLSTLDVPVLVLNGEADVVIPPKNSEILAKTLPHAHLVRWKEGGHAMIYQYPKEISEAINYFIRKTS